MRGRECAGRRAVDRAHLDRRMDATAWMGIGSGPVRKGRGSGRAKWMGEQEGVPRRVDPVLPSAEGHALRLQFLDQLRLENRVEPAGCSSAMAGRMVAARIGSSAAVRAVGDNALHSNCPEYRAGQARRVSKERAVFKSSQRSIRSLFFVWDRCNLAFLSD